MNEFPARIRCPRLPCEGQTMSFTLHGLVSGGIAIGEPC